MSKKTNRNIIVDLAFVGLAIIILVIAGWTWLAVVPVAPEVVVYAITFALIASFILLVSALLLVLFRLRSRVAYLEHVLGQPPQTKPSPSHPTVEVVTLTNVERRILNRLEEAEGKMTQDQLRRATGLSKSTLSVALSSLERKLLITRQTLGRTKLVQLIRELKR